jgi:dienelactone hydrolase
MKRNALAVAMVLAAAASAWGAAAPNILHDGPPLAGTARLEMQGDITSQLVEGADRFLLGEIEKSVAGRARFCKRDLRSREAYELSLKPNRERLAHILGVRDPRVAFDAFELLATTAEPALVGEGTGFRAYAVRWPAFADVHGEGLLLVPTGPKVADIVAIPDADQTPEQIAGLAPGVLPESQFARRLAESGCQVLIPVPVDRQMISPRPGTKMTHREYIYRSAFELGRHVIGYELQKVLAAVDCFSKQSAGKAVRIGVIGWGDGGMLALYAGALDPRIKAVCVSGYFNARENVWQEPLDHNVFGLLEQFGDAELAAMIVPRTLVIEAAAAPKVVVPPGLGGGPGRIVTPKVDDVDREYRRARQMACGVGDRPEIPIEISGDGNGNGLYGSALALMRFLATFGSDLRLAPLGEPPRSQCLHFDPQPRQARQVYELIRHNQWLLGQSAEVRKKYFERLDTSSLEKFRSTVEPYRRAFYEDVIGRFDRPLLPPAVRSRKTYDEPKWAGYEVVMDVLPDVIAYGILLVPKDLQPGQRRPVVVCQHGLEGRPQDTIAGGHSAYSEFASKLAERGFVTFAPQNLYIFTDRFRTLQRKANLLGKTLFSIIVPQHQQICDWLATLPFVDKDRIAFYGLSYGGKSAMRIPPLVDRYCLSICSGDFNEWIWKNASIGNPYTYMNAGEYEMFEFDLGNTFNYAEMAALIAPRPFMVERGHFDGCAPDEAVASEFAKVRFLYQARLGIGDRCELEWFNGPHMIHGAGTYDFLHQHLKWPKPAGVP